MTSPPSTNAAESDLFPSTSALSSFPFPHSSTSFNSKSSSFSLLVPSDLPSCDDSFVDVPSSSSHPNPHSDGTIANAFDFDDLGHLFPSSSRPSSKIDSPLKQQQQPSSTLRFPSSDADNDQEGLETSESSTSNREQALAGKSPELVINSRRLRYASNSTFFACYLRTLQIIHDLLKADIYATKRDIYYRDVALYKSQPVVDRIIEDLAAHLRVERFDLHVLSSTKGLVYGNFSAILSTGTSIDFHCDDLQGSLVPQMEFVVNFKFKDDKHPKLVMIVEKASVFTHLLSVDMASLFGEFILVTGKGFPDLQTKRFVRMLYRELNSLSRSGSGEVGARVPFYSLMDGDPYGLHIHMMYTAGDEYDSLTHASGGRGEGIKYLGFEYDDLRRFEVCEEALLPLSMADRKRGLFLLSKTVVSQSDEEEGDEESEILKMTDTEKELDPWLLWMKRNVQKILMHGYKAEIQSLIMFDQLFLKQKYLVAKIINNNDEDGGGGNEIKSKNRL